MRARLAEDRWALAILLAASLLAFWAWGGSTRPMEDTGDYRLAAEVLRTGWHTFPDRAPGYPLVLLLTGAARDGSGWLFTAQLAAHAVAVLLAVDLAHQGGVGRRGRVVLSALLVAPPVLQAAAYAGTEVWAELGLVLSVWLLVRWEEDRRPDRLVLAGSVVGLVTLVRPTYQLLVVPMALLVGWAARGRRPWRSAALLASPVVVLVGGLVLANAIRFDTPAVDRLLPYHLSQKTALVVEDLPESDEPARSILVESRDRLLVEDGEHSPAAFLFRERAALERATGLRGAALDRWVLRRDLRLIRDHPVAYAQAVEAAAVTYVQVDPRNAADGGDEWLGGLWFLVHLGVTVTFIAVAVLVPGVALTRGMPRRLLVIRALSWTVAGYSAVVTLMVVGGEPRTRFPTDPLLVLLLVSGASYLRAQGIGNRWPLTRVGRRPAGPVPATSSGRSRR